MVEDLPLLFVGKVLLAEIDLVILDRQIRIPTGQTLMNPILWTGLFWRAPFESVCGRIPCVFEHHLKYYKLQIEP